MSDTYHTKDDFLKKITGVVEENLSKEQFGVSELAHEIGMSRSNLLRKVKKMTQLSISQFIRQVRLKHAMAILKQSSLTVSEVAFQVGFSSTSYFIKCFREHYGYPPGEARQAAPAHQLAAIMFTDIQGYTALMQQNEEKALQWRNRHRQVFKTETKKFNGKILQYYGDGTLSIFQSAIDAVKCGIAIQQGFRLAPPIPVRVGIHSGDIIFNEEEIIGDGVNVASRIESLAIAGSVLISGKVYDEVKNQSDIQTVSLGHFDFKNVDKPLEVFSIANPGLVVPKKSQLKGKLKKESGISGKKKEMIWGGMAVIIAILGYLLFTGEIFKENPIPVSFENNAVPEKSIAVLPFINDSNDSTNVYIINGLMESILNNLQKIEDLRVISRTSVEKYRNTSKIIPEIAQELGVHYFVEGSGQKINDQILLNIQLIEASSDRHLWAEQYNRETSDIFSLQIEVAKKIADEIQVIITPEEEMRLDKAPTENLNAYDAYLKGRELFYKGDQLSLEQSILYYKKAVEIDPEFAHAYAGLAITHYFLDLNQSEKQYSQQINDYADKALLYDAQLPNSLIAKALFYIQQGTYSSALPHLEKALEYNPNSALVINILADFYTRYIPDTEKYLEYALRGIRLDIASHDSTTASFIYLHVSNAFIQSGFVKEAEKYINKSLSFDPENLFSAYVKAFILYAKNRDLAETRVQLLEVFRRDTTRLDVLQEVGKICYFMRDYEAAYKYYKKFLDKREAFQLDIYQSENAKIAMVMRKMGFAAEAEKYMQQFKAYTAKDQSIYKPLNQAMYYAFDGEWTKAIEDLRQFSKAENYHYWILVFLELDPLVDEFKTLPAFKEAMREIEIKFWDRHKQLKKRLEEQHLIGTG